ncbi:MAG: carbon-nitrogen hydrolase family protein [Pseudomonadota bacterium]
MSMPPVEFRAAVVQTLAALGDVEENIRLLKTYTREAVRQNARLVVFPECMNTGYLFDSKAHCADLAELVSGRYVSAMAELCRTHNIHMASGFTERDETSGKIFNSGLLLDPAGDLILHYHKQFLATHDQNWFEFGENGCPVVDTELGRIGLLICFDGRIPEIARCLALQQADIVVDMANFFAMDQADLWVPARAYENGMWFVAATKSGVERSIYYPGGSMIVSPDGDIAARIPCDRHGVVSAAVCPGAARKKQWFISGDRFLDRRPDTYAMIQQPVAETPLNDILATPLVPESATTKGAAVQAHATQAPASLDEAIAMVDHTAKLGVKVLVLPQFFSLPTWLPNQAEAETAQKEMAGVRRQLSAIASSHKTIIVVPGFDAAADGLVQSAVIIGPDGEEIGRYHQVHPEPEIRAFVVPGDRFSVFETPYGRLGILLGYDGMFPEASRVLSLMGADMIAWSSAWRDPKDRSLLVVPKAEDNRIFLICANRTDSPCPGGSLVVPPTGFPHWDLTVSAPPNSRHGAVMPGFVNLALARQKSMIPGVDMLRNRMVHTYGPIVETAPTR